MTTPWELRYRTCPDSRELADRHYNRQTIGSKNFAPPGRCMILYGANDTGRAFWITSYPFAEYVLHQWGGAFVCSAFRNEGLGVASDLIRLAVAHTLAYFPSSPVGFLTFINPKKVKPIMRRGVKKWGYTWERAGFQHVGESKSGMMAFLMHPSDYPIPISPIGFTLPQVSGFVK